VVGVCRLSMMRMVMVVCGYVEMVYSGYCC